MARQALVTSKWLAEAVAAKGKMRILDASWYLPKLRRSARSEFKRRHIAGAAFFDIDQCCDKTSPLDHMLPPEKSFADYVGNLGIENDTHVVVYDASEFGAFSAPRVWWMFRVFGHRAVSLLNGGLRNWELDGRPVSDKYQRPAPSEFKASLNRTWVKTYEDMLDNLDTKKFQVVDARPEGRFRGLDPEPRDSKWSVRESPMMVLFNLNTLHLINRYIIKQITVRNNLIYFIRCCILQKSIDRITSIIKS
nr:PREDICTED: 3-mercaptopyruvate sulfurtransferase-like [Paralichthys olivaceus]